MIVFSTVIVLPELAESIPPPKPVPLLNPPGPPVAVLPLIVSFNNERDEVGVRKIAPPLASPPKVPPELSPPIAMLLLNVQLVIVAVALSRSTAPPLAAFPNVPPPAAPWAELPENVLLVTVSVAPAELIAPPVAPDVAATELFEMVVSLMDS